MGFFHEHTCKIQHAFQIYGFALKRLTDCVPFTAALLPEHMGQDMPWPLRLLLRPRRVWRFVSWRNRRGAWVAGLRKQQQPADRSRTRRKTPGREEDSDK